MGICVDSSLARKTTEFYISHTRSDIFNFFLRGIIKSCQRPGGSAVDDPGAGVYKCIHPQSCALPPALSSNNSHGHVWPFTETAPVRLDPAAGLAQCSNNHPLLPTHDNPV